VSRVTRDVDILALARRERATWVLVPPPVPLPPALVAAIRTVGRDLGLAKDWLNTGPALQWKQGLPPGIESRIEWRRYAALDVGLAGRKDLIPFKLYAAADDSPRSRHVQDLVALRPTDAELDEAAQWVKTQDVGAMFVKIVDEVVDHVRTRLGADRG
jgi:hypothetical protein